MSGRSSGIVELMPFFALLEVIVFSFYALYYTPDWSTESVLSGLSRIVFLFSILYIFIVVLQFFITKEIKEDEKSRKYAKYMMIIYIASLPAPFLPCGSTYQWFFSFSYTVFFGFFIPVAVFAALFRLRGGLRSSTESDWFDTALFIMTIFMILASSVGMALNLTPSVSFYGGTGAYYTDNQPDNRLFIQDGTIYAHISVENTGLEPAEGIHVVFRNRTVYTISFLAGKSRDTYEFPLGPAPQGHVRDENISATLTLVYDGNAVDSMRLYVPIHYTESCGDTLLIIAGLVLAYRRRRR